MRNRLQHALQTVELPERWNRLHGRREGSVLWRRRWTVTLVAAAAFVAALAVSNTQSPIYGASAEVLLQPRRSERLFSPDGGQQPDLRQSRIQTELRVMSSRSVRDEVAGILKREPDVGVKAIGDADVVVLSAQGPDAAEAAREVNVYAETYISVRRKQLVDDLMAAGEQVQAKVGEIGEQIRALDQPLAELQTRIAALDSQMIGASPATQRGIIAQRTQLGEQLATQRRQVESLQDQQSKYEDQLDQLQLASNLTQTGGAQLVSRAVPNDSPVRPRPVRDSVLGLFGGLVLGALLALWQERTDTTVKDQEELELEAEGLEFLGTIPHVTAIRRGRRSQRILSVTEPTSPFAEAYRGLRTSIQLLVAETPSVAIQVTSPAPGDGKTTVVANLAVALARAGHRVAAVDLDLRRPRLHRLFGLDNSVGMASLLDDENLNLSPVVHPDTASSGTLTILPAGPLPTNPGELLTSPRTAQILAELKRHHDFVLVDSAPVLSVADALTLTTVVDETVLVVRSGKTTKKSIRRALKRLQQVAARVVGVVMNDVPTDGTHGYGYYYTPGVLGESSRRTRAPEASNGKSPDDRPVASAVTREDQR
jgi:polysaccharide biosynthesis transport protein